MFLEAAICLQKIKNHLIEWFGKGKMTLFFSQASIEQEEILLREWMKRKYIVHAGQDY